MSISVRAAAFVLPVILGLGCTHARSRTQATAAEGQGALEGHAADQVLSGKLTQVTGQSLSIRPDQGEERTLQIAPRTIVTVDGEEATLLDLQEGQDVRASFSTVDGRDVAVRIDSSAASEGKDNAPDSGAAEPDQSGTDAEGGGTSPGSPEPGDQSSPPGL